MARHAKTNESPVAAAVAAVKGWSPLQVALIGVLFVGLIMMTCAAAVVNLANAPASPQDEQGDSLQGSSSNPWDTGQPEGSYLAPAFDRPASSWYAENLNVDNASAEAVISLFTTESAAEPLVGEDASSVAADASSLPAVEAALAAFADEGFDVGFIVLDMQTGEGLSYNADGSFFSASTIKAPYVTYIAQDVLDAGLDSKDAELEEAILYDGGGVLATDDQYMYTLEEVIAYTIEYSDNNGYGMLRERYGEEGFAAWLEGAGASTDLAVGGWYPYYGPRDLAKLWLKSQEYFNSGAENAAWCQSLFSQTQLSFIRDAIGDHAEVHAKAGYETTGGGGGYWYYDWWSGMEVYYGDDYSLASLNDAGIVSTDTGDYLLAVLTNAGYDEYGYTDNEPKMVALIQALDAARNELLAS